MSEGGTKRSFKILQLISCCLHQQHPDPESRIFIKRTPQQEKVGAHNKEPIQTTERCSLVHTRTRNGSMNLSRLTTRPSVPAEETPIKKRDSPFQKQKRKTAELRSTIVELTAKKERVMSEISIISNDNSGGGSLGGSTDILSLPSLA